MVPVPEFPPPMRIVCIVLIGLAATLAGLVLATTSKPACAERPAAFVTR